MAKKKKSLYYYRGRSAETGRFVTVKHASINKKTCVVEKVKK